MIEMSITSIVVLVVCLFVFRKPIKQLAEELPEAVSSGVQILKIGSDTAVYAMSELQAITITNCNESHANCVRRLHNCASKIVDEEIMSMQEAIDIIQNKGGKVKTIFKK